MPNTPPAPGPADLDPDLTELIRRKARAFRRGRIPSADVDDVRQGLTLAVLAARRHFRPGQGALRSFVYAVLERAGSNMIRARTAGKRDPRRVARLPEFDPADPATVPGRVRDSDRTDLRLDLDLFLAGLTPAMRAVLEHLKTHSVAAAARALGIPRSTLVGQLPALRRRLEAAGLREYFLGPCVIPSADG